jgi:Domain of unknown function DUF11
MQSCAFKLDRFFGFDDPPPANTSRDDTHLGTKMNTTPIGWSSRAKLLDFRVALGRLATVVLFAATSMWLIPSFAQSTQPVFALAKHICTGNFAQIIASGSGQNPASCSLATNVAAETDAYYVITITNPIGQPQQQVNLIDALPQGFMKNGAIVCRDDATPTPNSITLNPGTGANTIGSISLAPGTTVHCFIQGKFSNPTPSSGSTRLNTVNANNGGATPFNMTASVSTNVLTTTPLLADLSVTKTSSGAVNIASGPALITYTIVIKNNGTVDADVADYFKLNDNLSLPPNGVPLNVEYVGSSCVSTASTNCLSGAGPNLSSASPLFVGPYAPTNFFDWGFDSGKGMIKNGGSITLTVVIRVSQVPGMGCTQTLNGNGINNQAFFTLASASGAFSELNSSNNTSSVTTGVSTGQTTVDPNCGKGHMRIKKTQVSPPLGSIVPWGTPVTYEITIENFSIPSQNITVAPGDLQDLITQGMNTPPFSRRHLKTACTSSTDPLLCASFNPGITADPNHSYKFYGESKRAWATNKGFTLASGGSATFQTQFAYEDPACDTVPNAQPKPIINTAKLRYTASAYGAASNSPQGTPFDIEASATTQMAERPVCEFLVTKKFSKPTPRIQFGVPFSYEITYSNNGTQRTVGTLLDAVRLTISNYASKLPYTATWNCKQTGGITPITANGTISGNASYTTNPMQGAPAANIGSNVFFPTKSTLSCQIDITLQRPAPNDPFCTQDKAEFENLALMDVTNPFNSNIAWPPSSSYNPANSSNPTPQNVNWAAVKAQLPACWDAAVNKSATVDGLPATNAPWTYVGGPGINYSITTTNKGQSNLGNPLAPVAKPQWLVEDNFTAPYANSNVSAGSPICGPTNAAWCHSAAPMDPRSVIAIKNLAPQASGVWNIKYNAPFLAGNPIKNCANVKPDLGLDAGNYYLNFIPSPTPTACVTIPVVEVTEIKIKKLLVDNTGGNVKAGGPFDMQISGAPYPVPSNQANFSLTTDITGMSPVHTVFPVARASSITLSEITAPIPPASAQACGGAGNVDVIKEYQDAAGLWKPMPAILTNLNTQQVGNNITVRNTLKCKPAGISITKVVTGPVTLPSQYAAINQSYTINAACNPASTPTSVVIFAGAQSGSGTMQAMANSSCNFSEPAPALPQGIKDYCSSTGQTAAWDPVTFSPANPVTLAAGTTTLTVTNKWKCVPVAANTPTLVITKKVEQIVVPGLTQPYSAAVKSYQVTANCSTAPAPNLSLLALNASGASPASGTISVALGANCAISEAPPSMPSDLTNFCGQLYNGNNGNPWTAAWEQPVFTPSANITITTGTNAVTVTNKWKCLPPIATSTTATLTINKVVAKQYYPGNSAPNADAQNYSVNASCYGSPVTVNASGTASGSNTVNVTPGANCSFSEPTLAMPANIVAFCVGKGTPTWKPPVFTPASLTVANGSNSVTVTNSWECATPPPTGVTLQIKKVVKGPTATSTTPVPIAPIQSFQVSSSCFSGSVSLNAGGATLGGAIKGNLTLGANCTFSEATPTIDPLLNSYCATVSGTGVGTATWSAPVFTPPSLILASGINTATVTNTWGCAPAAPAAPTVKFYKIVNGPSANAPSTGSLNYSFSAAGASPASVSISATTISAGYSAPLTAALGSSLNVIETLPSLAGNNLINNFCGSGKTATWNPPTYAKVISSPPTITQPITMPITMTAGETRIVVTNSWKCVP